MTEFDEVFEDEEMQKFVLKTASLRKLIKIASQGMKDISIHVPSSYTDDRKKFLKKVLTKIAQLTVENKHKMDVNEKNVEICMLFDNTNFELVRLETGRGDYESCESDGKTINIERKEDDFFGSLFSGHLYEQLLSMHERGKIKAYYLIVTKSYDQLKMEAMTRDINPNVLIGTVASLTKMGFPPIFIEDPEDCVKLITKLCDDFAECPDRTKVINRCVNIKSNNIIKFPHVGDKIGERLLEHFGSIKAVCNATIEELKEVKGVGKRTAEIIHALANGEEIEQDEEEEED